MSAAAHAFIDNTYLRSVSAYPLVEHDEMLTLARKVQSGDKIAREKMINSNLRLVIKTARCYYKSGIPVMDLISQGNEGLMHAVDRFDPEKGFAFSTYADHWIRFKIEDLISRNRAVHVPTHQVKEANKIQKVRRTLQARSARDVSNSEVASVMRDSGHDIDEQRVAELSTAVKVSYSLDAKMNGSDEDDSTSFMDMLEGESSEGNDPESAAYNLRISEYANQAMGEMDDRQKLVISHYYGLNGLQEMTLADIGRMLGVSRERARQLLNQTMKIVSDHFVTKGLSADDVI